jgi:hypothetical protein
MNRVLISVEGQTEETFVREILVNHLQHHNVYPIPVVVATKIVKQGHKFKGGITTYSHARNDILKLLKDKNAAAVTTMYDLYQLPSDFPGYSTRPAGDCFLKAAYLENEFQREIADERFKPYLQVHEYEAFLFVAPEITARVLSGRDRLRELRQISASFNSPEEINDGMDSAPSKRILHLYPNYQKPLDGALVVLEVGIDSIRTKCRHFNEWLSWLEGLG